MHLLDPRCRVCDAPPGADGVRRPWCEQCRAEVEAPPSAPVAGIGEVPAVFAYAGSGADVVRRLKFRAGRGLLTPLADELVEVLHLHGLGAPGVVTWVPTTSRRRRDRGYDQAELLARAVARRLDRPCRGLLRRRPGPAQASLGRADRQGNVRFEAHGSTASGVVVLDDVCTTGATLRAALAALGARGHRVAGAAVIARTP